MRWTDKNKTQTPKSIGENTTAKAEKWEKEIEEAQGKKIVTFDRRYAQMNCENKYDMEDEDYKNHLINSHRINATEIQMETLGSKDSKQTNETKKEQQGIARSQRLWNIVVSGEIDVVTTGTVS